MATKPKGLIDKFKDIIEKTNISTYLEIRRAAKKTMAKVDQDYKYIKYKVERRTEKQAELNALVAEIQERYRDNKPYGDLAERHRDLLHGP